MLHPIKVDPPWLTSLPHHLTPHIPIVDQTPSGAPNAAATTQWSSTFTSTAEDASAASATTHGTRQFHRRRRAEQIAATERTRLVELTREHANNTEKLGEVGAVVASRLDREAVVQKVTDVATELTHAQFGAFFYNVTDPESGNAYMLYTLSGAQKDAFATFPHPRVVLTNLRYRTTSTTSIPTRFTCT